MAIITANLALARSMYLHFLKKDSSMNESGNSPYYNTYNEERRRTVPTGGSRGRNRSQGGKRGIFDITLNSRVEHPQLAPGDPDNNVMWSECRRASSARSATASEIPLEPQIQKKTEFYVHEDAHSEGSNGDQIEVDERDPQAGKYS